MHKDKIVPAVSVKNRTESELLAAVLTEKEIPFILVVHETFLGEGLFILREGWGHIEAPESHLQEIRRIYDDLFSEEERGGDQ